MCIPCLQRYHVLILILFNSQQAEEQGVEWREICEERQSLLRHTSGVQAQRMLHHTAIFHHPLVCFLLLFAFKKYQLNLLKQLLNNFFLMNFNGKSLLSILYVFYCLLIYVPYG